MRNISFLLVLLAGLFQSCDDPNDWDVDNAFNRMFSPVVFETASIEGTTVTLRYSAVAGAKKYVFEFSKDSLAFNEIVKTVQITAEEMVIDSTASNKRYLYTISQLEGDTQYSARIKASSNDSIPDSKWIAVAFQTKGEQIINEIRNITESSAVVTWDPVYEVTHYSLSGAVLALSDQQKQEGLLELSGLAPDTKYEITLLNGETERGTLTFTTLAKVSEDGTRYNLNGTEDLATYLTTITDKRVVLVLPAGSNYTINGTWDIPAHVEALTIWGLAGEEQATVSFSSVKLDNAISTFKLHFYNTHIQGTSNSGDYILNDNAKRTITDFVIEASTVNTFRGLHRQRGAAQINRFAILNSIVSDIGSYGILSVDAEDVSLKTFNVENSTFYNVANASVFTFKSKAESVNVDHCTFFDAPNTAGRYLFNFNGAANVPDQFSIKNSIFAASDASVELRATNPAITNSFVSGSYKTIDFTLAEKYPLSGVSEYAKSYTALFADALNGDFTIEDDMIAQGAKPGDPRWW